MRGVKSSLRESKLYSPEWLLKHTSSQGFSINSKETIKRHSSSMRGKICVSVHFAHTCSEFEKLKTYIEKKTCVWFHFTHCHSQILSHGLDAHFRISSTFWLFFNEHCEFWHTFVAYYIVRKYAISNAAV